MSKVVHLRDDAHSKAKDYCKVHGLKMSDWVAALIERAMAAGPQTGTVSAMASVMAPAAAAISPAPSVAATAPAAGRAIGHVEPVVERQPEAPSPPAATTAFVAKKKVLEKISEGDQPSEGALPPYAQPPFWSSNTNNSK